MLCGVVAVDLLDPKQRFLAHSGKGAKGLL